MQLELIISREDEPKADALDIDLFLDGYRGRLVISIIKEIPAPWGAVAFPRQTGIQPGSVARHTSICGESRRKETWPF